MDTGQSNPEVEFEKYLTPLLIIWVQIDSLSYGINYFRDIDQCVNLGATEQ